MSLPPVKTVVAVIDLPLSLECHKMLDGTAQFFGIGKRHLLQWWIGARPCLSWKWHGLAVRLLCGHAPVAATRPSFVGPCQ